MNKQKGFTIFELLFVVIWLYFGIAWLTNLVQLLKCDFEPSYRSEIVHAIGVVMPPAAMITVWMD